MIEMKWMVNNQIFVFVFVYRCDVCVCVFAMCSNVKEAKSLMHLDLFTLLSIEGIYST